jgi:hypothetical protein
LAFFNRSMIVDAALTLAGLAGGVAGVGAVAAAAATVPATAEIGISERN